MRVHVSIYSFGEIAFSVTARMSAGQKKEDNFENNKVDYKFLHQTEHIDTRNCSDGEEWKLAYIIKTIEERMNWGDVNFFVVTDDMLIEFQDILQKVEYKNKRPVYMLQISKEDHSPKVETKKINNIRLKTRKFCQGRTADHCFVIKTGIETKSLVDSIVKERYLQFSEYMGKSVRNRQDPFDAPFVHIPDFLIYYRRDKG